MAANPVLQQLLALGLEAEGAAARGLAWRAGAGEGQATAQQLEASSLRLRGAEIDGQVGRAALDDAVADLALGGERLRVQSLRAARATLSGVKLVVPLDRAAAAGPAGGGEWRLAPLAQAEGTVRAHITDVQLTFDADVTVPVRGGEVRFNDASVAHIGPDSRMGVSRLGVYVDAPNGRSYLYQFPATPLAGVEYESRGALLGPWVTHRGKLELQPFLEGLLRQGAPATGTGFTEQARVLLGRTALSGDVQLGDGAIEGPGLAVVFAGQAQGRNRATLASEAVGRGVTASIASLSIGAVRLPLGGSQLEADSVAGEVSLRLFTDGAAWHVELSATELELRGLRLQRAAPAA